MKRWSPRLNVNSAEQRTMLMEDEEEEETEDGASHTRITRNQMVFDANWAYSKCFVRCGRKCGNIIAVNTTTRVDEDEDAEETTNLSATTGDGNEEQQTNKKELETKLETRFESLRLVCRRVEMDGGKL